MSDSKEMFDFLEGRLPELYALVIELSVKSAAYMKSPGRQSNEGLVALTDIIASYLVSSAFEPFSLRFQPLLDEIATHERELKELAGSLTAMAAISMSPFDIEIHYHFRILSLFHREFNMPGENEERYGGVGKFSDGKPKWYYSPSYWRTPAWPSPPLSGRPMKEVELTTPQLQTRALSKSGFNWIRPSMVGPVPQLIYLAELVDSRDC